MLRLKESECATFTLFFSLGLISSSIIISSILHGSLATATSDSVVDEINITVPISCSLTGTGMNTHNAEIPNGTYTADIGTTTLKAFCNDNEGFAIYAAGYTGNEIGGTNSNKLVGTAASSNATIVTGTAISAGSPDISNWAMKLNTVSNPTPTYPIVIAGSTDDSEKEQGDPDFSTYTAVPNSYTKVAYRTSATDIGDNAEGATLTTTYAAYISKTQAADTYSGQVIYTLVHPASEELLQPQPATAGCINYFANASNAVGTMGCQSATDGNDIDLLASNFSRTGYGFAGWSNKYDYATNTDSDLKFYGPQETVTVPTGTTANGLSLYAVWVPSAGSLQDSSKVLQLCGAETGSLTAAPTDGTANLSSVSALTDQRDNQTYAIAKLADGKCWMIENLRLEAENTRTPEKQALAQGYGVSGTYGNFGGLADAESTGFTDTYSANSLYSNDGSNNTINIGSSNSPAYRMPRYNNLNTVSRASNPTSNTFSSSDTVGGMYSYGNYYTWHAAIADLAPQESSNSNISGSSLCPTGWHLPKGGSKSNEANNDFWSLVVTGINNDISPANYESSAEPYYIGSPEGSNVSKIIRAYPNNFLYSGRFALSSASSRGSYGFYWSSTAYDNSGSYALRFGNSVVNPGTNHILKYYSYSIRCKVSASS